MRAGKGLSMKIKKVEGYEPKYPMKNAAAKVGALAAAALITAGAATGCTPRYNGFLEFSTPQPTEVVLDGDIAVDPAETKKERPADVDVEGGISVDPAELASEEPALLGNVLPDLSNTGDGEQSLPGNVLPDPSLTK